MIAMIIGRSNFSGTLKGIKNVVLDTLAVFEIVWHKVTSVILVQHKAAEK
jgi:hypothetical protein